VAPAGNSWKPNELKNGGRLEFENSRFTRVLMSATGTSPNSVELYGAGAQTWRRAAALLTRTGDNQALGGAWFYVFWGRWCARWL